MKTIEASTAFGIGRKVGVRKRRTSSTSAEVKTPCIGVQSLPHALATSAEREREPAHG